MPTLTPTADQIEDARNCVAFKKFSLHNAPGTGKTVTLMEALNRVRGHVSATLIVVPRIAMYQWRMILIDYGFEPTVLNRNADFAALPDAGVLLTTWTLANSNIGALTDWCPEVAILDESHALVRMTANRTKGFLGFWDKETRTDVMGLCQMAEFCWFATGTPMLAYPDDLHPWLSRMHPNLLPQMGVKGRSRHAFRERFCKLAHNGFGWKVKGGKNEDILRRFLYEGAGNTRLAVRREKDAGLPALREHPVEIDLDYNVLSPEWAKLLRAAEKLPVPELARLLEKGNGSDDDSHPATVRRAFGLAKVPGAVEYLTELPAGEQRLVFFWHRMVGDALKAALGADAAVIAGDVSPARKDAIVADFKAGRIKVIIGQIGAMGAALDGLQHASKHAYFVERVGSPALMEQAISRLHRRGQTEEVVKVDVRGASALEEATDFNLRSKGDVQRKVMGA